MASRGARARRCAERLADAEVQERGLARAGFFALSLFGFAVDFATGPACCYPRIPEPAAARSSRVLVDHLNKRYTEV